ncbi:MAG TPA: ShlB/FhaC/HecB family hemolysin secretion/activation protein [Candidatus Desulfobacillus sp.]|nr:ShlB/FhaC/HecB family hemolysin secretion/activation protein [Candidatus Desulfobacillus sp.]
MTNKRAVILLALASLAATPIFAQTVPESSAQEQFRQKERERELRQQQEREPEVRLPRTASPQAARIIPEDEKPCFPILQIVLAGDEAATFSFALRRLLEHPDRVTGRCIGAGGLNAIAAFLQNEIIRAGYVTTRVLAGAQDLKTGELVLTVIPGRVRAVRFAPGTDPRVSLPAAFPIAPGDLLNLRDIEQGLENLKRPATADADIRIEPAEAADAAAGESDLVISYRQAFPLRLTLSADDAGSRATGKRQAGATLSAENPLGLSDLFYVNLSRGIGNGDASKRGTRSHTLHYSVPFGYWNLGMTAGRYRYNQTVAGINQKYIYSGTSSNAELKLSRVLYRDAVRKTNASLRGWLRTSRNFIDDAEIEVQRRRMAGWEAALRHREFIGQSVLDGGLAWRQGTGAFNALHAPEEPFGEGTSRPRIVLADAALQLPFRLAGQSFRYGAVWRGQWNRTPLVPQDRFAIGGRYTVRGFDGENVLMAERGQLLRNDLGWLLGDSGQELYLGLDYGRVAGASADLLVGRELAGAALGLRGSFRDFSYDVFAGRPLSRPDHFKTAPTTAGFNFNLTF